MAEAQPPGLQMLSSDTFPSPASAAEPPSVFLPGWGFDGRVRELRAELLPCWAPADFYDPFTLADQLAAWLEQRGIPSCRLLGWSLGGLVALDFARRYPQRLASLELLAVREHWPAAELAANRRELSRQPAEFMRSFYRKVFLGYKAAYRQFQQQLEADYLDRARTHLDILHRGLDFLATPATNRLPAAAGRRQCWHGRRDVLAPLEQRLQLPGTPTRVLEHGGHALFLEPAITPSHPSPRTTVQQRFNRAAATYDQHARLQNRTIDLLAAQLPPDNQARKVLELGCGTGNCTLLLRRRFPNAHLLSLDFAPAMLQQARQKLLTQPPENSTATAKADPADDYPEANIDFICQDAELWLAANPTTFDHIVANATMQWFTDLPAAMARIRAGLKSGGSFAATIFGPASLRKLDRGLQLVSDGQLRVAARTFPDRQELHRLLAANFAHPELHEHQLSLEFTDLAALLRHFRLTGTGGPAAGQPLNRCQFRRLDTWLAEHCGAYRATFQVFVIKGS